MAGFIGIGIALGRKAAAAVGVVWILATGFWNDVGVWDDTDVWID